jgi:hypothetical protein
MSWKEAKAAGKEAFKQATDQLISKKWGVKDTAASAQQVEEKVGKLDKKE